MKRALRILILVVGIVGTIIAAAVPKVPTADGGPLPLCPPKATYCNPNLPFLM